MHSTDFRNTLVAERRATLVAAAADLRLERAARSARSAGTTRSRRGNPVASVTAAVRRLTARRPAVTRTPCPAPAPRTDVSLADC